MMTYKKLLNAAVALYMDEKYNEAYDLVTKHMNAVRGNLAQMYNFRYSFLGKAGRDQDGFDVLKEAIDDKGFWYPAELLLEDDDLEGMRSIEGFNTLVDTCVSRQKENINRGEYTLKIVNPVETTDIEKSMPLFIGLHGDQENMDIAEFDWKSVTELNARLALMQSAEIEFSDGFVWEDYNSAAAALKHFVEAFENNYSKLIFGGFSAGSQVALWSILSMEIKPEKLILVAPWLPNLDEWIDQVDWSVLSNTEITVICGDQDDDCFDCSKELHDHLTSSGLKSEFRVISGLQHDFPENFEDQLIDLNV